MTRVQGDSKSKSNSYKKDKLAMSMGAKTKEQVRVKSWSRDGIDLRTRLQLSNMRRWIVWSLEKRKLLSSQKLLSVIHSIPVTFN